MPSLSHTGFLSKYQTLPLWLTSFSRHSSAQSLTRHRGPILPLDLNQQGQGVQVAQAVVEADREVDGEAGAGAGAGAAVVEVEVVVVEDS